MGLSWLKHKITGELHALEVGSKEYLDKAAERDESGKTVYEDRGVAAHAEKDEVPATGNINYRDYNSPDTFAGVPSKPTLVADPVLVGDERELHSAHPEGASTGVSGDGSVAEAATTPVATPTTPVTTPAPTAAADAAAKVTAVQ